MKEHLKAFSRGTLREAARIMSVFYYAAAVGVGLTLGFFATVSVLA